MKKSILLPDGTWEILEGTPLEIAEMENLRRIANEPTKRVPDGKLEKLIDDLLKKPQEAYPSYGPFDPIITPPYTVSCGCANGCKAWNCSRV